MIAVYTTTSVVDITRPAEDRHCGLFVASRVWRVSLA